MWADISTPTLPSQQGLPHRLWVWAPGTVVTSTGKSKNCMRTLTSKGNDLEIGTYLDEADHSLAIEHGQEGHFPTHSSGPEGKTVPHSPEPPNVKYIF